MILLTTDDLILDLEILGMIIEVILMLPIPGCRQEMSATHDTWMRVFCLLLRLLMIFQAEIPEDLMMIQECCHQQQQSQPIEGRLLGIPWTTAMRV